MNHVMSCYVIILEAQNKMTRMSPTTSIFISLFWLINSVNCVYGLKINSSSSIYWLVIILSIAGGVCFLAIIIGIICCCCHYKRKQALATSTTVPPVTYSAFQPPIYPNRPYSTTQTYPGEEPLPYTISYPGDAFKTETVLTPAGMTMQPSDVYYKSPPAYNPAFSEGNI